MKVLIVDDSVTVRFAEKRILSSLGINDIVEAVDGSKALAIVFQHKFDLILMDWDMPTLSGIETLKLLKANPATKSIPVVMVTGSADKSNIMEAIKIGASDYVIKPFTDETIQKKLQQVMKKAGIIMEKPAAPAPKAEEADKPAAEKASGAAPDKPEAAPAPAT